MAKTVLFLIPISIWEPEKNAWITTDIKEAIVNSKGFFVENARTARRAIKKIEPNLNISEKIFIEFNKHEGWPEKEIKLNLSKEGNWGLISEAGCPAVADPGEYIVRWAHQLNVKVKALIGPNSILLALMASGLNGQNFQFSAYLPIDKKELNISLKNLEKESQKQNKTQIFIETPYRSQDMLKTLINVLQNSTLLCIASGINGPNEQILTKSISEWKKIKLDIQKVPTVFLFLAQS